MKSRKTLAIIMVLITTLLSSSVSTMAVENVNLPTEISYNHGQDDTIITIDGCGYNAQEFMNRVLDYTIETNPINTIKTDDGSKINFRYNKLRQRTNKITDKGITTYNYDEFSNLKSEVLPDKKQINYYYKVIDNHNTAHSIFYRGNTYYYIIDNGIITGLLDSNNQIICEYSYDKNGVTKQIYEINGTKKIEHQDNSGDDFVGCVNALRYDSKYYDPETGMFCLNTGNYYDAKTDEIVGSKCYVDMKGLFGDQYETLSNQQSPSSTNVAMSALTSEQLNSTSTIVTLGIPSSLQQQLIYVATQKYNDTLNQNTSSYSGTNWYTNFSSSSMHYKLAARIIYAENTHKSSNSKIDTCIKYNRQGVAWVITNRLLEDKYRKANGKGMFFSSTTTPTLYSVLTKSGAFKSLGGDNAKGAMDTSNRAYQQAFLLVCLISVCSNFDEWDAVVPRPTGITSQCYNRGLTSSSSPLSTWKNVKIPGYSTNYAGKSNYSAFTYYSNINLFNVLFSYKSETLFIDSVYY